jgi:CDP-diacylglycerol--glycerol-3-phosphate 3-phosphatidyltransferase
MCHPWLAAGVTGVIGVLLVRELTPIFRHAEAGSDEPGSGLLGAALRAWFRDRIEPLVDTLLAAGISANSVTAVQLVASVLCGIAYGAGWVFTAGWLLMASGTLDVLDGAIARKGGAAGPRGAFVDSVVDRYGECAVFFGLAAYFRESWPLWAVLAAFFGAFMVSYTRARAEGLGADCRIGLLQRPERYVILGGGSIVSTLAAHLSCDAAPGYGVLVASVVVVAALANVTALQRAGVALRRLS